MAQQLRRGRLLDFQDLTDDREFDEIMMNAFLDEFELIIIFNSIFITLEPPRKELVSIENLMRYTPVRKSMRQICQIYRKVKRNNCIVRCSLKTTEIVLKEIVVTFEPWLGFHMHTIDGITIIAMKYIHHVIARPSDQFLPITRFYKRILLRFLHYRWLIVKDIAVGNMRLLLETCLNALPEPSKTFNPT